MGTRSRIGYLESDKIVSIYCHWDGYPSNNGKILLEQYTDLDSVKELVSGGNLSSLNNVEYYTNKGESYEDNKPLESDLKDLSKLFQSWEEYVYVFDSAKSKWFYCTSKNNLSELTEEIVRT